MCFNRKFEFRPSAIIFVENTEQVSIIVDFANTQPGAIKLRVRSGGHDHEGESNGTGSLLIDLSKMNAVAKAEKPQNCDGDEKLFVSIGPGARFTHIKEELDKVNLGIPHGACSHVGVAGFTFGGGWGPWTRKHGMACESLVAATIVIGNGVVKHISVDSTDIADKELLWALRGGGGMSYGIVTSLVFKAFVLPDVTFAFEIERGSDLFPKTTLGFLEMWENAIKPANNLNLIGTNLSITAKRLASGELPSEDADLDCTFNGYYGGSLEELVAWLKSVIEKLIEDGKIDTDDIIKIKEQFLLLKEINILTEKEKTIALMNWLNRGEIRVDLHIDLKSEHSEMAQNPWPFNEWDFQPHGDLSGDVAPNPHKITSRMATASWGDESRKALICSLQSPLLSPNKAYGIETYITLGAIEGSYYADYESDEINSSFPYKDCLFTIQYQAWWNRFDITKVTEEEKIESRKYVNRTEDWIDNCRNFTIPHTKGAFISFKDSSIPTSHYFQENYNKLVEIKKCHSKDEKTLLRTRKTIV
ncbi:MAG: FAD-binding oxidoreductase [Flavobacteriaceae bacterium]|nr:FAD-binding oxidoreductase [Flavobacteriaceae bacterium]